MWQRDDLSRIAADISLGIVRHFITQLRDKFMTASFLGRHEGQADLVLVIAQMKH